MRGMKKSDEECFGGFLVKEDLLLLASKTQSLSWLDTSQPAIDSIKKIDNILSQMLTCNGSRLTCHPLQGTLTE